MRWFVRLWRGTAGVACLLCLASAACADGTGDAGLTQAIEDCSRQADATATRGISELCPSLAALLQDSAIAAQLGDGWEKRLKPAQLPDILWLLHRYSQPPPGDAPDPQAVAPVLADLHPAAAEPKSWWSRFLAWLRQRLNAKPSATPGWTQILIDVLKRTPRWAGKAIFYVGLAAVCGLVLVLLWREARILWLDSRHARRARRHAPAARPAQTPPPLTLQDIDSAPIRDRPLLLLRLLVQALVMRRMLAGERALTHGELIRRAGFADAAQRARFARIVQLAEARQFAAEGLFGRLHPDSAIGAALDDGRALYRQLAELP